jgi:hypothetical protein
VKHQTSATGFTQKCAKRKKKEGDGKGKGFAISKRDQTIEFKQTKTMHQDEYNKYQAIYLI